MRQDTEQQYPAHMPPTPPDGMRWEYRGKGWESGKKCTYYVLSKDGSLDHYLDARASGVSSLQYFEAVPNDATSEIGTDPKGAAGKLKPQLQLGTDPKGEAEGPTPSRYQWCWRGAEFDFYRLCEILGINHHAQAHALKKIIRAGKSIKSVDQDIDEAISALIRWKEMMNED